MKMNQSDYITDRREVFNNDQMEILNSLVKKILDILKGKRQIMYSDIINLIIREDYKGEIYNQLIRWCNIQIKKGKFILEL